jgi:hypothetical protein
MKKLTKILIISIWIIASSFLIIILQARHIAPFQQPKELGSIATAFAKASIDNKNESPIIVHILDPRCSCSQNVIQNINDIPRNNFRQLVLLTSKATDSFNKVFLERQIYSQEIPAEEAKKEFNIETVPWMVILNPKLEILYTGGYATGTIKTKTDVKLQEIMKIVESGAPLNSLPSFGCVTSESLRRQLLMIN